MAGEPAGVLFSVVVVVVAVAPLAEREMRVELPSVGDVMWMWSGCMEERA
jgi:hypothetical protein